jgi:hypothetical protein
MVVLIIIELDNPGNHLIFGMYGEIWRGEVKIGELDLGIIVEYFKLLVECAQIIHVKEVLYI